jgi:TRAP-type C4-dicarboxylate transport system substrate-binding protein
LENQNVTKPTVRVGGYAPPSSAHSRGLDHFAAYVDEETSGEVVVDILYNVMDAGRPAVDLIDMVESGELTWCYFSTSYLGSSVPLLDALEVPFLFDSLDVAHRSLDGAFGSALSSAVTSTRGVEVLGYWDNGFRHLTNNQRPIRTPKDCEGLGIRLQPNDVHAELVASWGMMPTLAELSVGIKMIADGDVDAQENPLANTYAYGVDHRHITLSSHLYGARGLFANVSEMSSFGTELAGVIRRGARSAIDYQRTTAANYEIELRQQFEAEGREVIELSRIERNAFADAATAVIARARAAIHGDVLTLIR